MGERLPEGAACPDLLENEGEKVTNPPQFHVTPRGLKHPTPEGREKTEINKSAERLRRVAEVEAEQKNGG